MVKAFAEALMNAEVDEGRWGGQLVQRGVKAGGRTQVGDAAGEDGGARADVGQGLAGQGGVELVGMVAAVE
jgi:hypothetical protein